MKIVLSIFLILSLWIHAKGQTITVTGDGLWNNVISANTISTAGSDYNQNIITTSSNHTTLNVTGATWTVYVEKDEANWNSSLKLSAKRTGFGMGGSTTSILGIITVSSINGGENFVEILGRREAFFNGTLSTSSIPIQYEISNLSVLIPAGNYSTTVYYTISAN